MSEIEVSFKIFEGDRSGSCHLSSGSQIMDLLEKLDQNPETVLVKREGKIVSELEELEDEDNVKIVPVVSGG